MVIFLFVLFSFPFVLLLLLNKINYTYIRCCTYSKRQAQETKAWDVFQDPPVKVSSGSMAEAKWIDNSVDGLKIVTCIVTFLVVLGSATISKGTLLFIVSQITFNATRPYCNRDQGLYNILESCFVFFMHISVNIISKPPCTYFQM